MNRRLGLTIAVAGALALAAACSSDDNESGGGSTGGTGGTTGSGGAGGSAGGAATGGSGGTGATGGAAGSAGAAGAGGADASAGAAGASGSGGAPDAGADARPWPTCDTRPASAAMKTIPDIWTDEPTSPSEVWVEGVYVTGVSGGGCQANQPCQVIVQDAESYSDWNAGAQHAIKVRVSGSTAQHFVGVRVGDRIDVLGHAWRFNLGGTNELLIQVRSVLPGCFKKVGTGSPTPITGVTLADLTLDAYELTHGPLLVQLATVSGKPGAANEIFGIWDTGVGIGDASPADIVSISPFFLPGATFIGLSGDGGSTVDFQTAIGVFGLFVPFTDASPEKFKVLYPRTMTELVR